MKDPKKYIPSDIESKWQKVWEEKRVYQPDLTGAKRPFYNLMMFPYPSAEGLHVGNMYAFTGADINGRYKRMQGYDVFEPIGLDGFGIHSENYAIKIGKHPVEQAKISEKNFYRQLHAIGNGFAWENKLETYDPEYYRWTQWIFVQMFKHGLAYRKKSPVNFCPSCKTVLSDEQVIDGFCERCKSAVEKKEMEQWYFRITKYAERLLKNLETLEWTNKVKVGQKNWIGKKEGINITYDIDETSEKVTVFTTAPVNFGMTFLVLAPEHVLVTKMIEGKLKIPSENRLEVEKYVNSIKQKKDFERIAQGKEKTGAFTGLYAINGINGKKVPVWVSDFVLGHVGTGAVQGCPGHDLNDFQFAKKFGLPIIRVIVGQDGDMTDIDREEQVIEKGAKGKFVNSEFLNGLEFSEGLHKTMDFFEEKGMGKRVIEYKLRDWCISRQRYWGAPIPMIYCQDCADKGLGWLSLHQDNSHVSRIKYQVSGINKKDKNIRNTKYVILNTENMRGWYPVPDDQLPVLLPANVQDWKPEGTGKGPLAKLKDWVSVACPSCGEAARRETDVCDTFLDSSWYHMRYPSVNSQQTTDNIKQKNNPQLPWDPQITGKWLPVTQYIGGAEHTVLHLLYARFVAMVFKDLGKIDFEEPYSNFYAHGLIIAEGAKMSKSRGNVVIPDAYIAKYGADTLRTYLMFLGPFDHGGDFRDTGIAGMYRFLWRVWRVVYESLSPKSPKSPKLLKSLKQEDGLKRIMHHTIKEVTEDMENFRYNTAIAHIMEYVNHLTDNIQHLTMENIKTLILLLAPFAPHMTEELWQQLHSFPKQPKLLKKLISIHKTSWPVYNPKYLVEDEVTIIIQVNGKTRTTLKVKSEVGNIQKEVEVEAKKSEKVQKYFSGKSIRKVIFIPGKLVNFVA